MDKLTEWLVRPLTEDIKIPVIEFNNDLNYPDPNTDEFGQD